MDRLLLMGKVLQQTHYNNIVLWKDNFAVHLFFGRERVGHMAAYYIINDIVSEGWESEQTGTACWKMGLICVACDNGQGKAFL